MLRLSGLIEGNGRVFPLDREEIRLGRGSDNDIVLPDFSVSRKHAAVKREGDGWFVYDLKSTNGVQVNGLSINKAPLRSGDLVKIGIFEFAVDGQATQSVAPPPPAENAGSSISSATIVRRLEDFSAEFGLESMSGTGTTATARKQKRQALDQAYTNQIFGLLTRLARLLIQATTVEEVLEKVFDIAFDHLQVDRGFILLRDEEGNLECELSREGDEVVLRPEGAIPVSHTMLQEVMRERVALLTYDAQSDQRLVTGESIRIHQIRSAMCAPLWSGDKIIGVMQVDSPFHVGTFNEGDLDMFTALSNYATVAVERIRHAEQAEFDRSVRGRLERYHSPSVLELVMTMGDDAAEEGHQIKATQSSVLFADVVGFTPLSERLAPEEVAELLRGYFNNSVDAIFAHGGTLDKFIGDCVMAFFGAPVEQEDHATRAVQAAIDLQRSLARWNDERVAAGNDRVLSRVAINSGPVVVGDVGSDSRVDYTVLGNTVNIAARLEDSAAKPGDIVIGGDTFDQLDASLYKYVDLGEQELKGLKQRVRAYRILWREDET